MQNSNQVILTVSQPKTLGLCCKMKTLQRDSQIESENGSSSTLVLSRFHNNKQTVIDKESKQILTSSKLNEKPGSVIKPSVTVDLSGEKRKLSSQEHCVLPIKIALFILYAYMALGSIILHEQIGWDYVAAFYYLQLTFTTTGIGDLDPGVRFTL